VCITRCHVAAELFKRCDADLEASFLECNITSVDERQTTMILEVDSINACVRRYGSCGVDAATGRCNTPQHGRRRLFMPRLADHQDVQLLVDDATTQHLGFVAQWLRVDIADVCTIWNAQDVTEAPLVKSVDSSTEDGRRII